MYTVTPRRDFGIQSRVEVAQFYLDKASALKD